MGLFNLFSSKRKSCEQMINYATTWSDRYMQKYAISKNDDVHNEAFLFCAWAVWDYCLNNDMLPGRDCVQEYIARIALQINKTHKIDAMDVFELFKNRFSIYKTEIRGLLDSDYPRTKQYIPIALYCAIYRDQYESFNNPSIDYFDVMDEMDQFMNGFIPFWNELNSDLVHNF